MTGRKKIIAALLVVAALLAVGVFTRGFGLVEPRKADRLTLYGNVDVREVKLSFDSAGLIRSIAVEEGATVAAGQLLATLDARSAQDRLDEARASAAEAEALLAELRSGSRPQEVARAGAALRAATATYNNAAETYRRRKPLVGPGAISRNLWDQTAADLRRSEAQLEDARQALSLSRTGARREQVEAAEARLEAARARSEAAAGDLADTRLISPVAGTVVTRAQEPGAYAQPGSTVLTLAIARPLRVRAYVAGPDLSRVRPGMRVLVSADGAGRTYRGRIGYISPQAEFTPRTVETESLRADLVYRLRIIIEDPDTALRQGQPVTVTLPPAGAKGPE
ncbi:MAG TPA: HlyD family efflux transporter periplasmic adaptor subunit [Allosphingosinicella sp.]